jgi:hypothetical protein
MTAGVALSPGGLWACATAGLNPPRNVRFTDVWEARGCLHRSPCSVSTPPPWGHAGRGGTRGTEHEVNIPALAAQDRLSVRVLRLTLPLRQRVILRRGIAHERDPCASHIDLSIRRLRRLAASSIGVSCSLAPSAWNKSQCAASLQMVDVRFSPPPAQLELEEATTNEQLH